MSRLNELSSPLLDKSAASPPNEEDGLAAGDSSASNYPEPSNAPSTALDPEFDDEDRAALDEAASASRRQCTNLIRDHLHAHLSQNPESEYVTWVATLHPENATVTLDPRFHIPGNPWLTVYEEAQRDIRCTSDEGGAEEGEGALPTDSEGGDLEYRQRGKISRADRDKSKPFGNEDGGSDGADVSQKAYSGCVDLAVGLLLALTGMMSALGIEVCGLPIYMCEVLCHRITRLCSPPNICTILPMLPFWALLQMFRLADALLLVFSILTVELIAVMGMVVCAPLALSCSVGLAAHQRIRKLAHLTRWACRQCFVGWSPSRVTFGCGGWISEEEEQSRQGGIGLEESEC